MDPLFFSVRLPTWLAIFWHVHLRRARVREISEREPLSFIVIRLDSLGDVVLTTPLFRALKTSHPSCRCTVVVQPGYKSLLVTNPHIDEILTLPKIELRWLPQRAKLLFAAVLLYWTRLRHRQFDYAISPRWDADEHLATLLCILTHAAKRVGYSSATSAAKRRMNAGFDTAFDVCLPAGPVCHEIQRNLAVAASLGATSCDDRLEIQLTDRDRRRAAKLLANAAAGAKLIALGIGAQSPGRRWPLARYAETINLLGTNDNIQAVIVCSSAELEDALKVNAMLDRSAVIISGAHLREVCAVLERVDIFIGNDSGCAHLAAAIGCKTLVVSRHPHGGDPNHFNSPVRFSPHGAQVRILQPQSGRDSCKEACVVRAPHCIETVTVAEVTAAAQQMLSTPVTRAPAPMKPWMTLASQRLFRVHGIDAVRRAVAKLGKTVERPVL